jgi:hypothetical protein
MQGWKDMGQIIKDFLHHAKDFELQSVGDPKTPQKLHLHFRMISLY